MPGKPPGPGGPGPTSPALSGCLSIMRARAACAARVCPSSRCKCGGPQSRCRPDACRCNRIASDGPGLGQGAWISSWMKVYRVNEPPLPSPARAPAGRGAAEAVSRGRAGGGHFSRIAWAFRAGKKICPFNMALAVAKSPGFSRDIQGFLLVPRGACVLCLWPPCVPRLHSARDVHGLDEARELTESSRPTSRACTAVILDGCCRASA